MTRLAPPPVDGDPIAVLRWVRRFELAAAVFAVVVAIVVWDTEWLRWAMLALAVLSASPWPGAAAIIRRSERTGRPTTTLGPEQRRARARRAGWATAAGIVLGAFALGAILGGPGEGIGVAVVTGICVVPGALLAMRWSRAPRT